VSVFVGFRRFPQVLVPGHETLYRRFLEPIAKSLESTRSRFYHSSELLLFDFTRSGRPALVSLRPSGAKRCVFRSPYRILRNFTHCNRSADLPSPPPADREFFYRSSTTRAAFGTAGKGSPASRFFTSPDLIALHRIYTIALYVNYPIQSYDFYFFLCRDKMVVLPAGNAAPHPVADKLISLFLHQVD
jgi:hypothetical protein